MEKRLGTDVHAEAAEGGLKELVLTWFQETQAAQMMSDGNFPVWFQGLAPRKHAEDLLRDKGVGSFLIRLSDKAIGYILSYKGHDRCRHFVITQNQHGQFVVAGDCELFDSLNELIEHYRVSPIQPFGEFLTFSCCEEDAEDLYDMVNVQRKSEVSVQALRKMWQKSDSIKKQEFQHQNPPPQNPVLPPKSRGRKLKETVSVDGLPLPQLLEPESVASFATTNSPDQWSEDTMNHHGNRDKQLSFVLPPTEMDTLLQDTSQTPKTESSLVSTLGETEARTDEGRSDISITHHRFKGSTNPMSGRDLGGSMDTSYPANLCSAGDSFSELNHEDGRCHSLPQLNSSTKEEENPSQLDSPSFSRKKVTCQTYSLHAPSTSFMLTQQDCFDEGELKLNPLYGSCEGSKEMTAQQEADTYAEVPKEPTSAEQPDDTYEPVHREARADHANTYESLQDVKTKTPKPNKQKNNKTWKKFLPDYKKK